MDGEAANPPVAVIIPCYNHGAFLLDAVASVHAQSYRPVSCVVVDDGSTDAETVLVLDRLREQGVGVIRQEHRGLASARNTGVRATDTPFFVPLDADDKLAPEFISRLLPPLLEDASLGYCYSRVTFFGAATGGWECPAYDPRRLLIENLSVATAVVRRAAFDLAGGYSPDMVHGFEDWDLWLALLAAGYHGQCVPEPLFHYRKHPQGRSMLADTQRHRAEMIHRMIEHHRPLFAWMLQSWTARKDSTSFRAHADAWRLREALARRGQTASATGPADDELYRALMARAELDYLENSRTWQAVQRAKRNLVYRAVARLRFGPGWDSVDLDEDPCRRLARIKASRSFRFIQAVKRTRWHRWYARRKYGPSFAETPLNTGRQDVPGNTLPRAYP